MRALFALIVMIACAAGANAQPREGFAELAEALSPSVVNISAVQRMTEDEALPTFPPGSPLERFNDLLGDGPRIANSLGSGFVIDADGIVVTNNHVIDEADEVEVTFPDGRTFPAEIVGRDPATDLAVLRIEADETFQAVPWGDSDAARVGDWVVAIGNPFGFGGSLTAGVISARGREIGGRYDDYLQTDVAINQGNSGGPLFNMDGEVVGVNTAIFTPTGASVGISFSIPSNIAVTVVDQLLEYGETRRGWVGINVQPVTSDMARALGLPGPRGAIVSRVEEGGPAEAGGLRPGDVILAFNGVPVPDDRRLPRIVAETSIGTRADVDILRRGEAMTLEVEVERLEETPPQGTMVTGGPMTSERSEGSLFGLNLTPLTQALRRRYDVHPDAEGLLVTGVDPASDAVGKVREGDVIEEIAWTPVDDVVEAREIATAAWQESGEPVLFTINRDGQFLFQALSP
ncbi:Do family serine endopeptidase [Marinicauda algicola]|uniref:Do family serine endopeptidase n=1 Tax=Marinicauda algicola TaxID=2029849 RepID=A0A4V3RXY2_9PROT|nr:Do family serine endopeptidase [Marinicauda algicola]TGY88269.1 Do family serine endopeptidase [Marinicauda algicola]